MTKDSHKSFDESLIRRISLLKYSLKEATNYLKETTDDYAYSTGISLLHDVIENLFWAIDAFHGVNLKDKQSLPEKYGSIISYRTLTNQVFFNMTNIVELNTIRNSFKHKGILPNIKQSTSIVNKLLIDFNQTVNRIFDLDINSISLSMLIQKDDVKKRIQEVEKINTNKITTYNNYCKALQEIGRIYFDYYEKNDIEGLQVMLSDMDDEKNGKKKKRYLFFDKGGNDLSIDFLELGIIPFYYHRFKNIVPSYGLDREKNIIIEKVNSLYWSKENWTKLNTEFCLNWIIDYVIRKEKIYSRKDYKIESSTSRLHVFKPIQDIITNLMDFDELKKHKFIFKKNMLYLAYFFNYVNNEWQDYEEEEKAETGFMLYCEENKYHGEISKNLLEIKEIYFDELSSEQRNVLLEAANNAKM